MGGSLGGARRAGSSSGVAGKTSILQSPSRETPGQVELDLDDGAQGYCQVYGFSEVPCFAAQRLPGRRKGSLGSGRRWCPYQGSDTTVASLTWQCRR